MGEIVNQGSCQREGLILCENIHRSCRLGGQSDNRAGSRDGVAGILDGLDAAVFIGMIRGIPVIRVFQFIASGAIGLAAFRGGWPSAALGLGCHFTIAMGAAVVYYLASLRHPQLLLRPFLWGSIYGLGVFAFMRCVVVPLSAAPKQPPATTVALANLIFSHIFFVGIPIALINSKAATKS